MPTIATKLRVRLFQLGLTQAEFARRAKVTPANVSHYLHGHHVPDRRATILRMAAVLGVTPQWFDQ